MMRRLILMSLFVILAGAAGNTSARQDMVATLLVTAGRATVTPPGGETQEYAQNDAALINIGDQIAISDDGEALLAFFTGTETRLVAGTVLTVDELSDDGDTQQVSLTLSVGQAMNQVEAMVGAESRFEVNTPAATISVRGTHFIVFARPNELTQVATLEGLVEVSALDQTVELPAGYGVKVPPGEAPGTVNVWGLARLNITAPEGVTAENLPVIFKNTANEQIFQYRSEDLMTVVTGPYEMTVNIPAPFVLTGIEFPAMEEPGDPVEFDVPLGALVIHTDGETGDLIVRFTQGDLSGETTVAPGDPSLAAPGTWTATIALASNPDRIQNVEITVTAGETLTLDLASSDFALPAQ